MEVRQAEIEQRKEREKITHGVVRAATSKFLGFATAAAAAIYAANTAATTNVDKTATAAANAVSKLDERLFSSFMERSNK